MVITPSARLRAAMVEAALLAALLLPLAVAAGDKPPAPYALIFGTVYAPDSRPAYGVKIKIRRMGEKKAKWELLSDHHGEFAQRVPAGKAEYLVWADVKGQSSNPRARATVQVENDERRDISLHLIE